MTTVADVNESIARWIHAVEIPAGSDIVPGITDWYGLNGNPWCAMWVSRVFYDAGLPLDAQTPKGFALCTAGDNWFAAQGRRTDNPREAAPGDIVFFDWDHVGILDHVGIVLENAGHHLITAEGNVGQKAGVFTRYYPEVYSLGKPDYTPAPPAPTPGDQPMKAVILVDPRDGKYWHAFGNAKVYLNTTEQVQILNFLGVAILNPAPADWIDALATLPR